MINKIRVITLDVNLEYTADTIREEIKSVGTNLKKSYYVGYDGEEKVWEVSCDLPTIIYF